MDTGSDDILIITQKCEFSFFLKQSPPVFFIEPKSGEELGAFIQISLENLQTKIGNMSDRVTGRLDKMQDRLDDLERSVEQMMTQGGVSPRALTPRY